MSFDSTSREFCTVRRLRTNTPLQALTLLNDTVYLTAARALAQKMIATGGKTPEERIEYGFRSIMVRRPAGPELHRLDQLLIQEEAKYNEDRAAASRLLNEKGATPNSANVAA